MIFYDESFAALVLFEINGEDFQFVTFNTEFRSDGLYLSGIEKVTGKRYTWMFCGEYKFVSSEYDCQYKIIITATGDTICSAVIEDVKMGWEGLDKSLDPLSE